MWMLISKDEAVWSIADVASSGSYIFWDRVALLPKPMDGVKVLGGLSHIEGEVLHNEWKANAWCWRW